MSYRPRGRSAILLFALAQAPGHADAVIAAGAPAIGLLPDTVCTTADKAVDEKGFVRVGGIEQWVRIKGASCANPVIVVVHGGPGNPNTPFADNLFKTWEQAYTVVQWDQRGAGMTFGRNPVTDDEPLVPERLRDDGVEVARYVAKCFGKRQVILMGGSWGSVIGVYMAKSTPEVPSVAVAGAAPPSLLLPEQFSISTIPKGFSEQEFVVKTATTVTRPCVAVSSHDKDIDFLISKELIENLAISGSTVVDLDEQGRLASIYGLRAKLLLKSISAANDLNGCAVASVDGETQYLWADCWPVGRSQFMIQWLVKSLRLPLYLSARCLD